jgi:hypothetical protein
MYISYFNTPLRIDNKNKFAELRIYSEKIASRAFGQLADFVFEFEKAENGFKLYDSHYPTKNPIYTKDVKNILINEPYLTKIYLVIRNPKDRLLSGLAQILFRDNESTFERAAFYLRENLDNVHISLHNTDIYHIVTHKKNSILKSRRDEVFTIEDIDNKEYYSEFYESTSHDNYNVTNKSLYPKAEEFINFIRSDKRFTGINKWLDEYEKHETKHYEYLKSTKYF